MKGEEFVAHEEKEGAGWLAHGRARARPGPSPSSNGTEAPNHGDRSDGGGKDSRALPAPLWGPQSRTPRGRGNNGSATHPARPGPALPLPPPRQKGRVEECTFIHDYFIADNAAPSHPSLFPGS